MEAKLVFFEGRSKKVPKNCYENCSNNLENNLPHGSVLGDTFSGFKQN